MTYLHLVADNSAKFSDPRALPAVYMLCYLGIDVSAQDREEEETALHMLVRKPGTHKIILALLRCVCLVHISMGTVVKDAATSTMFHSCVWRT